jgi:hypothetical protein
MYLPNADVLKVEQKKITGYLLNTQHRYGASKAKFFTGFGFSKTSWEMLALALQEHGRTHEVSEMAETVFGRRYEVEGELRTPDGRTPRVRSVWQVDPGMVAPRRLTAYPLETNYD